MGDSAALAEVWRMYHGWAARARAVRADLNHWRLRVLVLTVSGAGLATLASQLPAWFGPDGHVGTATRVLSGISAAAMALAAHAGGSALDPAVERQWLRARALGEICKSESYRFAVRVPPYDGGDAGSKLLDKLQQLLASAADIPATTVADAEAARGLPSYPLSVSDYIEQRLEDQIKNYYRPRASDNERWATRCAGSAQGLNAGAAVLSAIGAVTASVSTEAWVAVAGTIAVAISSFALGHRFQRLAATYRITSDRLSMRLALWKVAVSSAPISGAGTTAADSALVQDCEVIMAAENEAWLAEFLKDAKASAQATGG